MSSIKTVLLSGACCNPLLVFSEKKIETLFKAVGNELDVAVEFKAIPISTAAVTGLGMGEELDNQARKLFEQIGFRVLPLVIIEDEIAFYGITPSKKMIMDKILSKMS